MAVKEPLGNSIETLA
jgi:uncharacterized protein YjbJ (UPF0337 family)